MQNERLIYLTKLIAENSDEQAFNELFRMYFPPLLSFSNSVIKDRHIAEEVVIDVFLKLWENRKILPSIQKLPHYLYISTKHASIDRLRSKGHNFYEKHLFVQEFTDEISYKLVSYENRIVSKELIDEINNAINSLPKRCRLIFKLIKEDGLKYTEVAKLLDISAKTVENQMTIAFKHISSILKTSFPEHKKYYK